MEVMHRLRNVAILPFLERVKRYNTGYEFVDYPVDDGTIREAAESGNAEDRRLLWMCSPLGAGCYREWDVFLSGTRQHAAWLAPEEDAGTRALAFAIEVTGLAGGQPRGSMIDLDYGEHCRRVRELSRPVSSYRFSYMQGDMEIPAEQYMGHQDFPGAGPLLRCDAQPSEPGGFGVLLAREREERERRAVPCKCTDLLTLLRNRWVDAEARRIVAVLKEMAPNYGECFEITISRAFVGLAKQRDIDRLYALLPYGESMCVLPERYEEGDPAGKIKDVHIIIGPEENREVEIISEF